MLSGLRAKPPGLPPGSAVFAGHRKVETPTLRLVDFTDATLEERDGVTLDDLRGRARTESTTWIDVVGLHDVDLVKAICEEFGVHPLSLEDILNPRARSKLEEFDTYVFFTLKEAHLDEKAAEGIQQEAVSVVLGERFVLTFQEIEGDCWDPVRERLRKNVGRIRKLKADYFAYALLDAVVDGYFLIVEQISDRLEGLENLILGEVKNEHYGQIHDLRRLLLHLHLAAAPLRELSSSFLRVQPPFVAKETRPFLRDVNDHAEQVISGLDFLRHRADQLVDIYHAEMNHRLGQATVLLSVIATIFLPITFIAGVYGMNFKFMPERDWVLGYPMSMTLMALVAGGFIAYFRRRGWI